MKRSIYLERYAYGKQLIKTPPHSELALVVVIPCYAEPDLITTLQSLANCTPISGKVEVLVIVNQSAADSRRVKQVNRKTLKTANQWLSTEESGISFHVLHQTLPEKQAGVGLARKIGMDEAVRRFRWVDRDGIIACLDADCTCQANYLHALKAHFDTNPHTPGCSIYFEHSLEGPLTNDLYRAIASYELHLRYYTHGLKFSGLPCAFETIGSSMAVRTSAYERQGGMNTRKAGEDFYFLQKIIKLGGFTELRHAAVYPSSRPSTRVPFGTGKAMVDWKQKEVFHSYHPQTFVDLKVLTSKVPELYRSSSSNTVKIWNACSAGFQGYLQKDQFTTTIEEFNGKTNSFRSFEKRFFQWCDGFFTFKFANYVRENWYPEIPVEEAASWLLEKAYGLEPKDNQVKALLMQYRMLDKAIKN